MGDGTTIAGVSVATIALIISIICLLWILMHIGQRRGWPGSGAYGKTGLFEGGMF